MIIATEFITISIETNTKIAAAAFGRNAGLGCPTQSRICNGKTVYRDCTDVGGNVTSPTAPTTINGAVSPIARPAERIIPVKIPGKAFGMTTFRTVCQRVVPSAREASLKEFGTAFKASCVTKTTIGNTKMLIVRAPAKTLLPRLNIVTKTASPNIPKTIDGTPAKFPMFVWINRVNAVFLGVNSSK